MSDFEKIRATVIQCFQNVGVFLDSSQQDISINEYDLDSIAYISFIVEIEKALQIEVPDTYLQYDNFTSLNGFVNILCELINAPLKEEVNTMKKKLKKPVSKKTQVFYQVSPLKKYDECK